MRSVKRAGGLVVMTLLVAACSGTGQTTAARLGSQGGQPVRSSAQPSVVPRDPCADSPAVIRRVVAPRWKREPVPAEFAPVLLITCTWEERTSPESGEWTYRVEKRATAGLDAVVAALRSTPPPPPTGSVGCTLDLRLDPWFLLIDTAGRVVLPVVPHDRACDKPIDVGLGRLHYTTASATKIRQQSTPAEVASGCTDQWKNEPRIAANMSSSRPAGTRQTVPGRPTSVCTYASGRSEVGRFTGGARLTDRQAARIGELLTGGPANSGSACAPANDFALIEMTTGSWVYVELSGCHRLIVDEGSTFTAAVPELVAAVRELKLQR